MHALTKDYAPRWKRPEWGASSELSWDKWLPESEPIVREKFYQLKTYLSTLPKDRESYGLIHQDVYKGNFFVDEAGNITVFDFDDCIYGWFIYDIAIILFRVTRDGATPEFVREFMTHFLRGYRRRNRLDAVWLEELPHFLKLREIDYYAMMHQHYDVDNLEDPLLARYMENRRRKIENDVPYLDFDFTSLAACL